MAALDVTLTDPAAAQAAADAAAQAALTLQAQADQAAQAAGAAQMVAQQTLAAQPAPELGVTGAMRAVAAIHAGSQLPAAPIAVVQGLGQILSEVEGAISSPGSLGVNAIAFVGQVGGVAASLSLISNQTAAVVAAAGAILIPGILQLVATLSAHSKRQAAATVKAAVVRSTTGTP